MNEAQFYSLSDGFNRMFYDVENIVNPVIAHFYPIIQLTSLVTLPITILVFGLLLSYLIRKRKHTLKEKLRNSKNYYFAGALLIIYMLLSEAPIKIGPDISLNLGLIVLPLMAKKLGPLVAGIFGVIQYGTSFIMHSGEIFSLTSLLIAAISGMVYGRFLYMRKFTYLRCLLAKFTVNILCNVLLTPVSIPSSMPEEFVSSIAHNVTLNVILAPIQALLIYFAIYALKKVEIYLSHE
ncbi:MAG: hypothetical protein IKW62_02745 [Clostridia bacterium]|nr:hypothetical protein [Clostridia bacterium]